MTREELLQKINEADFAYYELDSPIMDDHEYDKLVRLYEERFGPLSAVPGNVRADFQPFDHPVKLLSLNKIYDDDPNIDKKLFNFLKKFGDICVEPKIDGLTIAAYPKADGSCFFVTRGDGSRGEILPHFLPQYEGVKDLISGDFCVRGEAYITEENFAAINKLQEQEGQPLFSNPRNAAAGILRNKERSRYLEFLSYTVYEIPGSQLSVEKQLQILGTHTAFDVISFFPGKKTISDIRKIYTVLKQRDIPIDGVVLKPYKKSNTKVLFGVTDHHPNDAVAWKKSPDLYETEIQDIIWQVGRDKLTPVAILKPVNIDNTKISRATLHNLGFVEKLFPAYGDILTICKSGEVIPKIIGIARRSGNEPFKYPDKCPSCQAPLIVAEGENSKELVCPNPECDERLTQNIAYLVSREVLDIKGISDTIARKLITILPERSEYAIFDLRKKDIMNLAGFGEKSAQQLFENIGRALQTPVSISTLFKACCQRNVGENVATILEKRYLTLDRIMEALEQPEDLGKINGLGEKTISIITSQNFKDRLKFVSELLQHVEASEQEEGTLAGSVWCITGKFPQMPRSQIAKLLKDHGATVKEQVTKDTTRVLAADLFSGSTKLTQAKNLGIKILSWSDLEKLLEL